MSDDVITDLQRRLREFTAERAWEQFHTPKNLAMALGGEVGELLAIFQWLTVDDSTAVMEDQDTADAVRDELADIAIYLLRLADVLDVDVAAAVVAKIERNDHRYPTDAVHGRADIPPRQL